jgi:hypothetical protein
VRRGWLKLALASVSWWWYNHGTMKRTTRADVILNETFKQVEQARLARDEAKIVLGRAQARYEAQLSVYEALEETLKRTAPKKSATPSSITAATAAQQLPPLAAGPKSKAHTGTVKAVAMTVAVGEPDNDAG